MARETWTDERLDDLREGMNGRFDRVDRDIEQVVSTMKEGFAQAKAASDERFTRVDRDIEQVVATMKEGFARVEEKFEQTDKRMDRIDADVRELRQAMGQMHTTMSIGFIGLAGLIVSGQIFF